MARSWPHGLGISKKSLKLYDKYLAVIFRTVVRCICNDFQTGNFQRVTRETFEILTRSTALSPALEGRDGKRRLGSTLSEPRHLCRGVEGLVRHSMFKALKTLKTHFKTFDLNHAIKGFGRRSCIWHTRRLRIFSKNTWIRTSINE